MFQEKPRMKWRERCRGEVCICIPCSSQDEGRDHLGPGLHSECHLVVGVGEMERVGFGGGDIFGFLAQVLP